MLTLLKCGKNVDYNEKMRGIVFRMNIVEEDFGRKKSAAYVLNNHNQE